MNDPILTLSGNVATDVRYTELDDHVTLASFRLAATPRRFDRSAKRWVDEETVFVSVKAWRALADNVARSLHKGDPVVVTGRVRFRSFVREDGTPGHSWDVNADAVGHDLARGTTRFTKVVRSREIPADDLPEVRERLGLDVPSDVDPDTGDLLGRPEQVAA